MSTAASAGVGLPRVMVSPDDAKRNYRLGVLSGVLSETSGAFNNAELIWAGLVWSVTGSAWMVALVGVCQKLGMAVPQLLAGSLVEHRGRAMGVWRGMIAVKAGISVLLLGALLLLIGADAQASRAWAVLGLGAFFFGFLAQSAIGGLSYMVSMDMIGRMIPRERSGRFFSSRTVLGSLLAMAAGVALVQPTLNFLPAPWGYVPLLVIGSGLSVAGMLTLTACREPDRSRARRQPGLGELFRRGARWLRRSREYRLFLLTRIAYRFCYLAPALFIPFGEQHVRPDSPGAIAALGGVLVAVMSVSRLVSSFMWGRVADRWGYRAALAGGCGAFAMGAGIALLAAAVQTGMLGASGDALPLFLVSLALLTAGQQGQAVGDNTFIILAAPDRRRSSYGGFISTATAPLSLLPLAGAAIASTVGLPAVFAATAAIGTLGLACAAGMRQPHR